MVRKQRSSSLRARLWKGWFLLATLIGSIVLGAALFPGKDADSQHHFGLDFIAFYRAGVLVQTGHADRLYDLQDTQNFDRSLARRQDLAIGNTYGLFLNPPFFAWIFAPLVTLGYQAALHAWWLFNFACLLVAIYLLCKMLPLHDWRTWALVPASIVVSLPFIQSILHGQNTFLSLLLMSWGIVAWRQGRKFIAGAAIGFLSYKPQLAAVILAAMTIHLGRRAFAGALVSLCSLILINLVTLPGTLFDYVRKLGPNAQHMLSTHAYLWNRHVTFNAFWHVLLRQSGGAGASSTAAVLAVLCSVPLAAGLILCIWQQRKSASPDRLIAAVVAASPLLMPYYLDYDLLLLAIPATLLAGEIIRRHPSEPLAPRDRWLIRCWIALFLLLLINPGLTNTISCNLAVPLLAAIATLQIMRATLKPAQAQSISLADSGENLLPFTVAIS
jgi:hypothetical protein